ncbi:uncharacterized protein L969DRAFT_54524 [Mixia osmundae IAM 14324]|uniref:uncharacterized protein n=1 Tax=Mixia osmundae (strain CBS 9802 / IAM 14324 / JCM 22182 / KY 12970) TaxID=764103 RepID=UPI0004A54BBF|nr:uncharacterized protein L969DRAFT_54524 [Mixia osmundae IAM 14324]KEI36739.1 hypothetical protein L969DRAFT_54524 [Mixia osmundae IAM 14324]
MTSVVGLDIGNLASKIGIARNRGIDIITNEVSNRATPSLVSFGPRSRAIGESAKTQETSNFRNTIGSLKRLIGRRFDDPEVQTIEKSFINAELVDVEGTVGIRVQYLGEPTVFSATQLYAMYLGKLREIAAKESKAAVNDVVIAVPGWYTDIQRRAVLDAAEIANLHPLRLINDGTATALGYGITKTDLPELGEKPRYVAFIDIGHSDYSVSIVAFNKGQLVVKATAFDRNFGGRDLDFALVKHFAEEFKGKYKIDVFSNQKALFRLATSVEKLKKILSANLQAPLSVESIMNDIDASSSLTRDDFEALIAPLLERTIAPLETALASAGIVKDDIDTIELVGGSVRVPALKSRIQNFFGKPLSTTTNQEEAIVRGATLACAVLSPIFKVRDFNVTDLHCYPIDITWEKVADSPDENTQLRVFEKGNGVPSTKVLSFYRKEPFELVARYADPSNLPGSTDPFIARYTISGVKPTANGDHALVKLKARLNLHGIVTMDAATLHEEIEGETPAEPAQPKKVKKVNKKPLTGTLVASQLDLKLLEDLREKEGEMFQSDKLVSETEDRKNALEEYIYDARDKIEGAWASYMKSADKDVLREKLTKAEDWLYSEEGEDATKSAYVGKLDELKVVGDPAAFKLKQQQDRPAAERQLRAVIADFMSKATSGSEQYSHLSEEDLQKVIEKTATAEKWINDQSAKQAERRKDEEPAYTSTDVDKRREDLLFSANPILNKPKPKPKVESKPATPQPDAKPEEKAEAPMEEVNGSAEPETLDEKTMDVD